GSLPPARRMQLRARREAVRLGAITAQQERPTMARGGPFATTEAQDRDLAERAESPVVQSPPRGLRCVFDERYAGRTRDLDEPWHVERIAEERSHENRIGTRSRGSTKGVEIRAEHLRLNVVQGHANPGANRGGNDVDAAV